MVTAPPVPLYHYTTIPLYHYTGANGAEGGLTVLREVPDHQMGGVFFLLLNGIPIWYGLSGILYPVVS
jgi:hypothetical protein